MPWMESCSKRERLYGRWCALLNMLYERAGFALSRTHITQSRLLWHQGSNLFEPCREWQFFRCNCNRLQQLVYSSWFIVQQIKPPSQLSERGVVILGKDRSASKASCSEASPTHHFYSQPNIQVDYLKDETKSQSSEATSTWHVAYELQVRNNLASAFRRY
jgi:hypothetical protein